MNTFHATMAVASIVIAVALFSGCAHLGTDRSLSDNLHRGDLSEDNVTELCLTAAAEYERHGQIREAVALYERARRNDPKAIDYSRRLAVMYDKLGEFDKADAEYRLLLADQSRDADLLNDYGYSLLHRGEFVQAEATLQRAVAIEPEHRRARNNLGEALARQSRYAEAFTHFLAAVGEPAAHCNLAKIMIDQGRHAEAANACSLALAVQPNFSPAIEITQRAEIGQHVMTKSELASSVRPKR